MALIYCPECKAKISEDAESCPRCGQPLKAPPSGCIRLALKGLFWAAVFATIGLVLFCAVQVLPGLFK